MAVPIHIPYFHTVDPTRTATLRRRFVQDMNRRFGLLVRDMREAIVDLDVFGLNRAQEEPIGRVLAAGVAEEQFDFALDADKINAFDDWIATKINEYLFDHKPGTGMQGSVVPDFKDVWLTEHIDQAYRKGIERARRELETAGIPVNQSPTDPNPIDTAFNNPIHLDRVALVYARSYTSLKSIASSMSSTISDVLAVGMAEGKNPRELARLLNKAITGRGGTLEITDSIGRFIPAKRRAELLARTEVIRAHHSANMGEYRAAEVQGIRIQVEHTAAGDDRMCSRCESLDGNVYSVEEAENIIPVHPQCRCVAIPVIKEEQPKRKTSTRTRKPRKPKYEFPEEMPNTYTSLSTVEAAQAYAKHYKFAKTVDYSDMSLEMANATNRAMHENIRLIPNLRGKMGYLGGLQGQIDKLQKWHFRRITKGRWSKKSDIPKNLVPTLTASAKDIAENDLHMGPSTWAHAIPDHGQWKSSGTKGIALNTKEGAIYSKSMPASEIIRRKRESAQSKWHPEGTGVLRASVDHEVGHIIDTHMPKQQRHWLRENRKIKELYAQFSSQEIKDNLAEYAAKNVAEFIAEAWSEYVLNPNPRWISRQVGDLIMKRYGNKNGIVPRAWEQG